MSEISKLKRLIKKYWKYRQSPKGSAEQLIRKKCKSATSQTAIRITKIKTIRGQIEFRPQIIEFELYERDAILQKPKDISKAEWTLYKDALQWRNDVDDIKLQKRNKVVPRKFIFEGSLRKKNSKYRPPVFNPGTPKNIMVMEQAIISGEKHDWADIIQYINPDYLDYEESGYVTVCKEITQCQPKEKQQKKMSSSKSNQKEHAQSQSQRQNLNRKQSKPIKNAQESRQKPHTTSKTKKQQTTRKK